MDRYSQLKATETLQVPETIEAFDGVSFFLVNEKQANFFLGFEIFEVYIGSIMHLATVANRGLYIG